MVNSCTLSTKLAVKHPISSDIVMSCWSTSVAPCHGCWWSLPELQNHCSLKNSHWSRRMCCLHCCACYRSTHYQEEGIGEFDKKGLLGNCFLYFALFHDGYSSSKLFTPSFPGVSVVWGHGPFLQYSGTLVMVHYCALAVTVVLQVTLPVCQAVRKRANSLRKAKLKLGEVCLFLILFLCPLLNSWEPFLPQLPSYSNYHCAGST